MQHAHLCLGAFWYAVAHFITRIAITSTVITIVSTIILTIYAVIPSMINTAVIIVSILVIATANVISNISTNFMVLVAGRHHPHHRVPGHTGRRHLRWLASDAARAGGGH